MSEDTNNGKNRPSETKTCICLSPRVTFETHLGEFFLKDSSVWGNWYRLFVVSSSMACKTLYLETLHWFFDRINVENVESKISTWVVPA